MIKNKSIKGYTYLLLVVVITWELGACNKGPGVGGRASIRGKVIGVLYDKNFYAKLDSGYTGDQTVNIIYGDNIAIGDHIKTGYDGSFEFPYLRKGDYTIFVYSRAHKTNKSDSAVVMKASITSEKQVIDLPVMKIFR